MKPLNYVDENFGRYFGSKSNDGTFQNIINHIPPHNVYCEPFAGKASIFKRKKLAEYNYLSDLDDKVVLMLEKYKESLFEFCPEYLSVSRLNYFESIRKVIEAHGNRKQIFIYLDPPYLFKTRKCDKRYKYDFGTYEEHNELLNLILYWNDRFKDVKFMISCYANVQYFSKLKGWNIHSFNAKTSNGTADEYIYYNYDIEKTGLHDYSYLGRNNKEREAYKLQEKNLLRKFDSFDIQFKRRLIAQMQSSVS